MSRWEFLEGVRAETPARVAVRELSKVIAEEMREWPPQVEWSDDQSEQRFSALYEEPGNAPSAAVLSELMRCLRWEFERDYEALDHYWRNHLLDKACGGPHEQLALRFLLFFVTEAYMELVERTENRVKRRDLLEGLGELDILLRRRFARH